ncbi:hypothetical protein LX36DRAFT_659741 [Colletotrichum falcatum]|nr:hypothetical protein LX36DRAFT_659741 [Colletotrichum falcatum]
MPWIVQPPSDKSYGTVTGCGESQCQERCARGGRNGALIPSHGLSLVAVIGCPMGEGNGCAEGARGSSI